MPANDQFWRPLGTMHKVFAISALALLLATFLMMSRDHRDEWRQYQVTADQLKAAQLNDQLSEIQTDAYEKEKETLETRQGQAQEALDSKQQEIDQLEAEVAELTGQVDLHGRQTKFMGARRDVARANYDIAVRDNVPIKEQQLLKEKFDALQESVDDMSLNLDRETRQLNTTKQKLAQETAARDKVAAEIKKLETESNRLSKTLANIAPDSTFQRFKRWLMLQPIVDGFNSPHGIRQEWLPDLPITYGMATTARFDRCRTCHVNINDFAAGNVPAFPHGELSDGKYPHPYSAHPNPDVYLTSTSPHPMPSFGCTICHDGDGSGTSFQNAEHTPDNPAEAEEWHHEYGWHSNHFWEYPMQPDRFIESSCIKCHHSVVELGVNEEFGATAPKVYEGYEIIKSYGCFGCHEINGYDAGKSIGPDLRLEAGTTTAARQLLADPVFESLEEPEAPMALNAILTQANDLADRAQLATEDDDLRKLLAEAASLSKSALSEMPPLAQQLADNPDLPAVQEDLRQLVVTDTSLAAIARTLRLQLPAEEQDAVEAGPYLSMASRGLSESLKSDGQPGRERKVGPSLRHVAAKTTPEFIAYWTEEPSRFRPSTKMPQFFHLSNQQDEQAQEYQPVQIAAIAAYLQEKSQPLDLMQPQDGYEANAERGKTLFSQRGCLACHQYGDEAFKGAEATFGPDLTKVHEKVKPGEEGFNWLYTWVRDPQRHHSRTKMPNLFLEPEGEGDSYVDPAADIAAFLLAGGPREFPKLSVDEEILNELVSVFSGFKQESDRYEALMAERAFATPLELIKGDEIELARRPDDPKTISKEEWQRRKLIYVGRRTISFYGCYGCHDIPEFETARPIGTALQDWGRKDTSKLALEHIEEFLHHHGGGHGDAGENGDDHGEGHATPTVPEIAEEAVDRQYNDGDASEDALRTAFFYESLQHHGRPGFIWQKLRQPRSYDFRKTETKGYEERLRMPKFPFDDEQIEAVTTFVLGLVAEPLPAEYLFKADARQEDVIEGERLLDKYNCGGCHIIDLPEVAFATNPEDMIGSELGPADYQKALDLLMELKPPQDGLRRTPTGEPVTTPDGENIVEFKGLIFAAPDTDDDIEDQEYSFDLWETLKVGDKTLFPGSKMLVPATKMIDQKPARGGDFAQWLVPQLMETQTGGNRFLAWQASPPPLYQEGIKVQTPWLYEFLKNPDRLRYTTVLRMPRFNMSDAEARALANYFAAADGAEYPYQSVPQQQPPYLERQQVAFHENFPEDEDGYLSESWKLLNAPLCIKCHSVGGNVYQSSDPKKDIRGPNLDRVAKRLQSDWTLLWLYKPAWITPYTSMPTVFPANQTQLPELFGGDGNKQTIATRDALMNYYKLMEAHGSVAYKPEGTAETPPQTGAGGQ